MKVSHFLGYESKCIGLENDVSPCLGGDSLTKCKEVIEKVKDFIERRY